MSAKSPVGSPPEVAESDGASSPKAAGRTVVRVLPRLHRQIIAELQRTPDTGDMTWPQFRVLGFLSERDYRASELASALQIDRSTLTTVGDGLVRRGLVERVRDLPGDRRGVLLRLTARGRALHGVLKDRAIAHVAELLASADPAECAGLVDGLEALERGLCQASAAEQQRVGV
ncbi:MAG TPA: MarR family transcriptional regulator [Chloroflexota bacterium]|nr:MarR family transcriptional regulator [Chloroflexota bacterium]